jgi:two-component system response regulator PilR (NtrC family)
MVSSSSRKRILCVDDSSEVRELLTVLFSGAGYDAITCGSFAEGLHAAVSQRFDLYLFEARLPDGSGLDLARRVRAFVPDTPIVFLSGFASPEDIEAGIEAGAQAYITKPMSTHFLLRTVRHLTGDEKEQEEQSRASPAVKRSVG